MSRRAFTLIELLIAMVIMAIAAGMIVGASDHDRREADVRAAAEDLAGEFRKAHGRALATHCAVGVAFHVQNQAGSSGRILNNRDGGHWFRMVGSTPDTQGAGGRFGTPPLFDRLHSTRDGSNVALWNHQDNPIRPFIDAVERSWLDERHTLPKGRVRFLALTDQDNGNVLEPGDTFPPTYPRPWFGWWDPTSKRLYPWGGYDPALAMTTQTGTYGPFYPALQLAGRTISHSGFFYEGYDGIISGCVNPADRLVYDDTNGDGVIIVDPANPNSNDDPTRLYPLWRQGKPRALIEGDWEDCLLIFLPDGRVTGSWMALRHQYAYYWDPFSPGVATGNVFYDPTTGSAIQTSFPAGSGHHTLTELSPADRCNRANVRMYMPSDGEQSTSQNYVEATWLAGRSGYFWVTLSPDASDDTDTFPDVQSALRTITPCYRVGIGIFGDVKVIRVRASLASGRAYDTTMSDLAGADRWNSKATTDWNYQNNQLTAADGSPRGQPIVDTLTPDMLQHRIWWWQ